MMKPFFQVRHAILHRQFVLALSCIIFFGVSRGILADDRSIDKFIEALLDSASIQTRADIESLLQLTDEWQRLHRPNGFTLADLKALQEQFDTVGPIKMTGKNAKPLSRLAVHVEGPHRPFVPEFHIHLAGIPKDATAQQKLIHYLKGGEPGHWLKLDWKGVLQHPGEALRSDLVFARSVRTELTVAEIRHQGAINKPPCVTDPSFTSPAKSGAGKIMRGATMGLAVADAVVAMTTDPQDDPNYHFMHGNNGYDSLFEDGVALNVEYIFRMAQGSVMDVMRMPRGPAHPTRSIYFDGKLVTWREAFDQFENLRESNHLRNKSANSLSLWDRIGSPSENYGTRISRWAGFDYPEFPGTYRTESGCNQTFRRNPLTGTIAVQCF